MAAGVTADDLKTLDMTYNKGPSSWVRAHIATYKNGGKRTFIMQRGTKFRAEGAIEDSRV